MSVNQAYAVTMAEVLTESLPTDKNELQISYYNATHFKSIARKFGLMDDFRVCFFLFTNKIVPKGLT